ncbi:MAG TPA: amidohydrolase family protein [Chloroflexota bacterium]
MARIIDAQFHWHPREFCELHVGRREYPRVREVADGYLYEVSPQEAWTYTREMFDLEFALVRAREAGITSVISSPAIGGDAANRSLSDAVEVVELLNSAAARAQAMHPDAFYGLAVLPMQDTAAALAALDQAASLGLYGVCVFSNIDGADIADRSLWPVYQRIEQLGLPAFLHPTRCLREPRAAAYALERPLGYMFDTSIAMMSLIVSGLMDACPQLKIVLPHLGGTLPFLLERLETYRDGILWPTLDEPIGHYLRRTYFDTVSETPGALSLALEIVDADHLLFATDAPYFAQAGTVDSLRQHLPEELLAGVFHLNAEKLLGLTVPELELDAT